MISLSATAIAEVKRLQSKHLRSASGALRINIQSTGCAGLSYQLDFDQFIHPEDQTFECGSIQIVVNPQSLTHINGLRLDYSEDLMGGSFRFHNPNAKQTCSCGHSFSTEATG